MPIQRTSRDILPSHGQTAGRHSYDAAPPPETFGPARRSLASPAEASREGRGEGGPVVCDVFVGDVRGPLRIREANPKGCPVRRRVPAVIRLPSVMRLHIHTDAVRELPVPPAPELTFHPPPVRDAPPQVVREDVTRELETFLVAEDASVQFAEVRAVVQRAERRLAVRQLTAGKAARAQHLHVRVLSGDAARARARERTPAVRHAAHPRPTPRARPHRKRVPVAARREPPGRVATRSPGDGRPPQAHRTSPPGERRQRIREAVRVAVGIALLFVLTTSLASVGRLGMLTRDIRSTARHGADALVSGAGALLTADAQTGVADFAEARAAFARAEEQLHASTSVLERIAGRLDPAGRLPAAHALLTVGGRAAALGTSTVEILRSFQESEQPLTETLEALLPRLESIDGELQEIVETLGHVERGGMPEEDAAALAGIGESLTAVEKGLAAFLRSQRVVLELLGSRQDRQYLLLFQNHRELRPSGGFIGSFALVDVSRGEIRKVHVDTIYNPDGQLKDFLVPPTPLQKITDRWFARDANWFADFRLSADKIAHLFERSGGPTVDGVIAVAPTLIEDLLRVTGPIPMPEYDVTVTASNALEVIQRLVTYEYDREKNAPKAFIADLLPEVLARVARLPRERWGDVVDVFVNALRRKQVLVFLRDEQAENAVLGLGWGGALPTLPPPTAGALTDHLGRVEANIGGHKTDTLIEQSVDYDVTVGSDGAFTATLVVTRHHRGPKTGTPGLPPGEDPARKLNVVYERTFVPSGSELLEARGFVPAAEVPKPFTATVAYESFDRDPDLRALEATERTEENGVVLGAESGFTTFGGWVVTPPEETTVTVLRYRLPFHLPDPSLLASILRYELLFTHQPGHVPVMTHATLRAPEGFRLAWTGPSSGVTLSGERKGTFTSVVDRDLTWGAVLEEQ